MKILRSLSLLAAVLMLTACGQSAAKPAAASQSLPTVTPTVSPTPTPEPEPEVFRVRFSATGDNLIHDALYRQAARRAGEEGRYDFSYCYRELEDFYAGFDLNWINQETLITDTLEPSTYPCFSTPGDMGRNLYDLGMRAFSLSNNHTYDKGAVGITDTLAYWNAMPEDVSFSGLYTGEEEDLGVVLREQDGITFAFLSYTQYTNGLPTPQNAEAHVIYTDETERIQAQVELADEMADFVIVSCHWGVEDSHTVIDYQKDLAQNLTAWGADLIVGTHPHVIQDAEWITAENGNRAFVAYSLGNSLSAQSRPHQMIGLILDITFEKVIQPDGRVTLGIGEPTLHPLVNHYDYGHSNIRLYLLEDYTEELALGHGVKSLNEPAFSYGYIQNVLQTYVTADYLADSAFEKAENAG